MRRCIKCNEAKPETEFGFQGSQGKASKRKRNICKQCHNAQYKLYYTANKVHHMKLVRKRIKVYRALARAFIYDYLLQHPCVDCKEPDPVVLQFDHVRGDRAYGIPEMVSLGYSVKAIKAELVKCEIRCANCHHRRHAKEGGFWLVDYQSNSLEKQVL